MEDDPDGSPPDNINLPFKYLIVPAKEDCKFNDKPLQFRIALKQNFHLLLDYIAMEFEDAIVLVPESDNGHTKLIELKELKLKSSDDYFFALLEVTDEEQINSKSSLSSKTICRKEEILKSKSSALLHKPNVLGQLNKKCLVCNKNVNMALDCSMLNVFKENCKSSCHEAFLSSVLTDILHREISKKNTHSEYICHACYELLDEWNTLSSRLKAIEKLFAALFKKTCECLKVVQEIPNSKNKVKVNQSNIAEPLCTMPHEGMFKIRTKSRWKKEPKKLCERSKENLSQQPLAQEDLISKEAGFEDNFTEKDEVFTKDEKLVGRFKGLKSEWNFSVKTGTESRSCESCSFKASSATAMTNHRQSHFCGICGIFVTFPRQMKIHLVKVHNYSKKSFGLSPSFSCNICLKRYSSKGSLHNHKKTAHNESTYVCNECGRPFRHPRLLAIHAARHRDKSIQCVECGARFFLTSELNKHNNQVHRKVRPYECPKCGHHFCQRSTLTHHLSQHRSQEGQQESCALDELSPQQKVPVRGDMEPGKIRAPPSERRIVETSRENYAPHVSLQYEDLTNSNPAHDDEKDEVEISLDFDDRR